MGVCLAKYSWEMEHAYQRKKDHLPPIDKEKFLARGSDDQEVRKIRITYQDVRE